MRYDISISISISVSIYIDGVSSNCLKADRKDSVYQNFQIFAKVKFLKIGCESLMI
jgi:hypothetical protein